jgi:hypothetical protein
MTALFFIAYVMRSLRSPDFFSDQATYCTFPVQRGRFDQSGAVTCGLLWCRCLLSYDGLEGENTKFGAGGAREEVKEGSMILRDQGVLPVRNSLAIYL